jgi:hypothetical protein
MAIRNRVDYQTTSELTARLHSVLNETVKFLRCPLTADEMRSIWHRDLPDEIKQAHELLTAYKYLDYRHSATEHMVIFVVPDLQLHGGQLGVRFYLNPQERDEGEFMDLPSWQEGPHHMPLHKFGPDERRWITTDQIRHAIGGEKTKEFFEWAVAAGQTSVAHLEAQETIKNILEMAATVGQVRRMVPEIVQYCTPRQQAALNEQERRSPFPNGWAEYDKSRVQRLLDALAKGHLVSGLGKVSASNSEFSWAQFGTKESGADIDNGSND